MFGDHEFILMAEDGLKIIFKEHLTHLTTLLLNLCLPKQKYGFFDISIKDLFLIE